MHPACQDPRCLFRCSGASRPAQSSVVTTVTREGPGQWERCAHCGLVINRSGVAPEQQRQFYNEEYLRTHSYVAGAELDPEEHFRCRVDSVKAIADGLLPFLTPQMRVLEIGAAAGELLYHLRPHVADVFANEIIQSFVEFVQRRFGMPASAENYLALRFAQPFDLIIAVNAVDHIYETRAIVEKTATDLPVGGLLYLEVPNDEQALRTVLPEPGRTAFTQFMYQRAHYYSFTAGTLTRLVEECGFTVVRCWSRHDYNLLNYVHWYQAGRPTPKFAQATGDLRIHDEHDPLGQELNAILMAADTQFRAALARHLRGETLCLMARRAARGPAQP